MKKEIVFSKDAPAAIGPYSQAIAVDKLIFTSGQLPLVPNTGEIAGGGISGQAEQALNNLKAVLVAGGASLDSVVKTTCFIAEIADFAAFNEVYTRFFGDSVPARSCFAVKDLPKGALVEIEAVAIRS